MALWDYDFEISIWMCCSLGMEFVSCLGLSTVNTIDLTMSSLLNHICRVSFRRKKKEDTASKKEDKAAVKKEEKVRKKSPWSAEDWFLHFLIYSIRGCISCIYLAPF